MTLSNHETGLVVTNALWMLENAEKKIFYDKKANYSHQNVLKLS